MPRRAEPGGNPGGRDAREITSSQETTTAAALTELHIPYTTEVVVGQADAGLPAAGVLRPERDHAVDGDRVTTEWPDRR